MWPTTGVRRPFVLFFGGLIGLAWVTLAAWGQSPYAGYLSHHSLEQVRGGGLLMLVFVAGWLVMLLAMMLPTTLPLLAMFNRLTSARSDRPQLLTSLVVGYVSAWTMFGMLVYIGDAFVHAAVAQSAWVAEHAWALGALTLLIAGAYQFSTLSTAAWSSAAHRSASLRSTGAVVTRCAGPSCWEFITACFALVAAGRSCC